MRAPLYSVVLLAYVILAGCNGGSTTAPTPATPTPAGLAIAYGFMEGTSFTRAEPAILYDQQFLDFVHDAYVLTTLPPSAGVTWKVDGSTVALSAQPPGVVGLPGDPVPTASPGEIFLGGVARVYGKATIRASADGATATLSVIHYPSLSLGCQFRYAPAFAFDPDRTPTMSDPANWPSADVFVTAPSAQLRLLDPCAATALATGTSTVWHVPHGGTIIHTPDLVSFANVTVAQWKNDGTSFAPVQSGTLLLKTAEGRFAKIFLPIGPYDVSSSDQFVLPQ